MKIIKHQSNLNTSLPLTVSIWEVDIDIELSYNNPQNIEMCLDVFKKRKFLFNEEEYDLEGKIKSDVLEDYNYSNFSLSKIQSSDFRMINMSDYKSYVEVKIQKWSKTYDNMRGNELAWFINVTKSQISTFTTDYSKVYAFDLDPKLDHHKRHPHFDLYEFFISMVFIENKICPTRICYVLMTYG